MSTRFIREFTAKLVSAVDRFLRLECGPTTVEYAILLALIIMVCASAVSAIGNATYQSLWVVVEAL